MVDALLVVFAVFSSIDHQGFPRIIVDEVRPFSWVILLLTMQALAGHVAELLSWTSDVLRGDRFDVDAVVALMEKDSRSRSKVDR